MNLKKLTTTITVELSVFTIPTILVFRIRSFSIWVDNGRVSACTSEKQREREREIREEQKSDTLTLTWYINREYIYNPKRYINTI